MSCSNKDLDKKNLNEKDLDEFIDKTNIPKDVLETINNATKTKPNEVSRRVQLGMTKPTWNKYKKFLKAQEELKFKLLELFVGDIEKYKYDIMNDDDADNIDYVFNVYNSRWKYFANKWIKKLKITKSEARSEVVSVFEELINNYYNEVKKIRNEQSKQK